MAMPALISFCGHRAGVNVLLSDKAVHPTVVASGSNDGSCRLWDVRRVLGVPSTREQQQHRLGRVGHILARRRLARDDLFLARWPGRDVVDLTNFLVFHPANSMTEDVTTMTQASSSTRGLCISVLGAGNYSLDWQASSTRMTTRGHRTPPSSPRTHPRHRHCCPTRPGSRLQLAEPR